MRNARRFLLMRVSLNNTQGYRDDYYRYGCELRKWACGDSAPQVQIPLCRPRDDRSKFIGVLSLPFFRVELWSRGVDRPRDQFVEFLFSILLIHNRTWAKP
jgi:hypothetical protein